MNILRVGWLTALSCAALALAAVESEAQESIGVSGYWTITVSDPDGSNAQVYQFSNALTQEGRQILHVVGGKLGGKNSLPILLNMYRSACHLVLPCCSERTRAWQRIVVGR